MHKPGTRDGLFQQIHKDAYAQRLPIQATFELTPRCTLDCRMCYVHLKPEAIPHTGRGRELTAEEWIRMGRQAQEAGVFSLCITGGEPTLHPEFETIWKELSMMGFRITLQTNAYAITDRLVRLFDAYPPHEAKITLYGSNDGVYRDVCRVEDGFTRVSEGIRRIRELKIPVLLVTTFVKQNVDDRDNIGRYAFENHCQWHYSTSCYPSLRGADTDVSGCALTLEELGWEADASREWNEKPLMKAGKKPCAYCSNYRTGYHITWDGYMGFCLFLNEPQIDALIGTFEENWQALQTYIEGVRWPEKCYTCPVETKCRRCIAHLACKSGGIGKLDETYCSEVLRLLEIEGNKKEL